MHRTCLLLMLSCLRWAYAQVQPSPVGNEWIDYGQTYFKIPIAQAGLYRITTADLQRAGVPISTLGPATLQLFHRGTEQAIYVAGEADGRFDAADFVEFYGRGNDGVPDSLLYRNDGAGSQRPQPHTYYSLFADTTAYFLTWRLDRSAGAGQPGKRMAGYTDTDYENLTPEPYHWAEELRLFTDTYPGYAAGIPPKIEYSHYEAGEGYTGVIQQKDVPYDNQFLLRNAVRPAPAPQLDVLLVGRDYTSHRVDCQVGPVGKARRQSGTVRFSTYDNACIRPDVDWNDVGANGQFVLSTISRGDDARPDRYSVSYIRLRYPQRTTADGQPLCTFRLPADAGTSGRARLTITNLLTDPHFWDITDPTDPVRIGATVAGDSARLIVRGTGVARTILSVSQPRPVPALQPVTFVNWSTRKPTYLIVSHEALMQPAGGHANAVRAYAAYRASAAGGGHDTLTATMQQLFDQFSYGERHPLAIRRFADQMLRQGKGAPQYLLLLGRGRSTPGIRRNPRQATLDLVMTAGFPGSDGVFTAGLNGQPIDVPAIPTGRINAGTPQEVINYLDKIIDYESPVADTHWRKNILHLSGGQTAGEAHLFRRIVDGYRDKAVAQALGARVTTLSKETDKPVEPVSVAKPVNDGVGLMTFFGHSGLDVTDLDIGYCSDEALGYQNGGRYPVMLINGCAIGNFYFGRPTLTTDWVLTPGRGAIAAIAHSHLGSVDFLNQYSNEFYGVLADSSQLIRSIGQIQQETIRRVLARTPDGGALANCQQMVLQGDPAIRPFPFETPDYAVLGGALTVWGTANEPLTTDSDSVRIRVVVQNFGQYRPGPLPVQIRRLVGERESGVFNLLLPNAVAYLDTLTMTIPNERNADGRNQFAVIINPGGLDDPPTVHETNRTNNQASVDVTVAGQKPVLIYPAPGSIVTTPTVRLTAEYRTDMPRPFDLELDSTDRFDSPVRVTQHLTATNIITYPVTLLNRPGTIWYWRVRLAGNGPAPGGPAVGSPPPWSVGQFTYAPGGPATGLPEGQIRLVSGLPADIRQGDAVPISVQFVNLSPYPFTDSLVIRQTVYAAGLPRPQTAQWRVRAPANGDTLRFTARVETEKLPGTNRVILTVNPRLQPEYSFLNNTLDLPLPVQPDGVGPVLEVAIDGARIAEGSVVAARPVIDVLVADDNRALIRRDTTGLNLFLQRPGENQPFERLSWRTASPQPAAADHVFRIRYASGTLPEGAYRLLVTARDAVGNPAVPYRVGFRVVGERALTDLTLYPNPFRDQVLFAFQLTGHQPPASVTISLTDLNGRVVRHLSRAGRIGLNEWTWDGRADSGERLPAGVYAYQLTVHGVGTTDALRRRLTGRLVLTR